MNDFANMGIFQHLTELRKRLIWSSVAIIIGATICYNLSSYIFDFFTVPFENQFPTGTLVGTGPAEAFVLKIKLACFAGFVLVMPFLFYQMWLFVAPGLYQEEKKLVLPFVFSSTILFLIGMLFSYYLVLPVAYDFFFSEYESIKIVPNIRITEHLSMVIKMLLAFGCVFEFPVISVLLAKFGLITSKMMITSWRYVVVFCFVVGAVLTPPDVVSQMLMAIPMLVLYVISIGLVSLIEKKQKKTTEQDNSVATL